MLRESELEDEIGLNDQGNNFYFQQRIEQRFHHYYLYGTVGEPQHYTGMIHNLLQANPGDNIHIHLNTQGGSLETGVAIINAMLHTSGHVVCILEGQAFSLGALIFLSGHEWIVHNHTLLMFHNYSGETWGKGNEIMAHMKAQEKWHIEITKEIYQPFLTSEEYDRLLKGEDFWFHPSEIRTRLKRVVKEFKKKESKETEDKEQK